MFSDLQKQVQLAERRPEVCDAVTDIYTRLQGEVDRQKPACTASGRCCRFEEYGHRLYVTTMELAAFSRGLKNEHRPQADVAGTVSGNLLPIWSDTTATVIKPGGCVFQVGKLCGVHGIRPFGCRIFYCDPAATDWQQQAYERFHAELKELHQRFGISYYYVEWREAIELLQLSQTANPL